MMRGPKTTAMAVRNTQGEVVIEKFPTESKKRAKILKLPIIRGVFGFIDSMTLGYKCLMRSAEISGLEEIEAEMEKEKAEKKAAKAAAKAAKKGTATPEQVKLNETAALTEETEQPTAADSTETPSVQSNPPKKEEKKGESSAFMSFFMAISLILALGLMILLFFWLPSFLYKDVLEKYVSWFPKGNRFLQSVCETSLRLLLLTGYMFLMRLMKDTRRTFQYHGAEHKTIFCYEHGLELTVENVRRERRFHPRCGTSFLVLMLLVGIVIGFFIPTGLNKWLRTAVKLLLLPITMGLGYELIKLCGKHDNWLTRIIAAPGLWFQRLTVLEPDDGMIECAIAAMKEVIPEDGSDQI